MAGWPFTGQVQGDGRTFAKTGYEPYRLLEDFCEKDSVSLVSRHPGGRHWNDLLGQRAQRPVNSVGTGGPANPADTACAVAGNAARCAADSVVEHAVFADAEQHAGPVFAEPLFLTEPLFADSVAGAEQHARSICATARFLTDAFGAAPGFADSGRDRS